jgi:hypothetical protein
MPRFCTLCGLPIGETQKFCSSCGNPAGASPGAHAQVLSPATSVSTTAGPVVTPGKKNSPAMKIILLCLGFFALLAVVGIAGVSYIGYRVHRKAEEIKQAYHLDQLAGVHGPPAGLAPKPPKACSLISKDDIEALTSQSVKNVVDRHTYCDFVTGNADSGVSIEVEGDAQLSMKVLVGGAGLAGRALGQNVNPVDPVSGIGDEAYYLGGKMYFRKGDVMVTIDTQNPLLSRKTTVAIAEKVFSKM